MTPKEKAKELVEKYKPFVYCYMGSGMLSNTYDEDVVLNMAKQCALITCDEILSLMIKFHNRHIEDNSNEIIFWEEVKNEINLL